MFVNIWRIATVDKQLSPCYTKEDNVMKKQFKSLTIKRGILYRKLHENEEEIEQLVIPECYRGLVLRGLHNDVGHPGRDRTDRLLRERFY